MASDPSGDVGCDPVEVTDLGRTIYAHFEKQDWFRRF
jgi:hypothetical protein